MNSSCLPLAAGDCRRPGHGHGCRSSDVEMRLGGASSSSCALRRQQWDTIFLCPTTSGSASASSSSGGNCSRERRLCVSCSTASASRRRGENRTSRGEGAGHSLDDAVHRKLKEFHEGREGPPLRILPVGGLGEIGMNCMLVGNYDRYIMIDAGLMFPDYDELGVQRVLPDTTFIRRWRDKIEAVIITHGHEDHIGALPWVIPALDLKTPIYSTGFTMQLIVKRLKEYNIPTGNRCKIVSMQKRFQAGPFEVEPVRVTHSIPDCCGLVLRCQDGTIFHTGDWKIDESPVDGKVFDRVTLEKLAKEGVTLMMSDSTNVLSQGRTTSETDVAEALMRKITSAKGRVITTQFASNVHRLGSVYAAAQAAGRKLVFLGLSLKTYFDAAFKDGQAPFDPSLLVKSEDIGLYSPRDLVIVTTGSQAEPRAALNLASYGGSRALKLNKDDVVLYSAKMIPGNETRVVKMMNRIAELGPTIMMGRGDNLHTSGHAYRGELEEALRLVKPQHFLPIHGEYAFMKEHELLGKSTGIRHTTVIKNGEMLGVAPLRNGKVLSSGFSALGQQKLKLMYNDGQKAFGTASDLCVDERLHIAQEGIVFASVEVYNDDFKRRRGHDSSAVGMRGRVRIITRCLWVDGGKLIDLLYKAADVALATCSADTSLMTVERTIGNVLRRVVQKFSNRRPDVVVVAVGRSKAPSGVDRVDEVRIGDKHTEVVSRITQDEVAVLSSVVSEVVIQQESLSVAADGKSGAASLLEAMKEEPLGILTDDVTSVIERVEEVPQLIEEVLVLRIDGEAGEKVPLLRADDEGGRVLLAAKDGAAGSKLDEQSSDEETDEAAERSSTEAKTEVKKRQRWTTEEATMLFQVRSSMERQVNRTRAKRGLWIDVSAALAEQGLNRTPDQCKSGWASLFKKYERLKAEQGTAGASSSTKDWPLFTTIEAFLTAKSEPPTSEPLKNEPPVKTRAKASKPKL